LVTGAIRPIANLRRPRGIDTVEADSLPVNFYGVAIHHDTAPEGVSNADILLVPPAKKHLVISFRCRFPQFCPSFAYHGHAPDKFAGDGLRRAVSVPACSSVVWRFTFKTTGEGCRGW